MSRTIYGIFWEDYVYVGQTSSNPQSRYSTHLTRLANRTHDNKALQQLYNLVPDELQFIVLENDADTAAEKLWIEYYGERSINVSQHISKKREVVRGRGTSFELYDDGVLIWRGSGIANACRATGWSKMKVTWNRKPIQEVSH